MVFAVLFLLYLSLIYLLFFCVIVYQACITSGRFPHFFLFCDTMCRVKWSLPICEYHNKSAHADDARTGRAGLRIVYRVCMCMWERERQSPKCRHVAYIFDGMLPLLLMPVTAQLQWRWRLGRDGALLDAFMLIIPFHSDDSILP